MNTIALSSGRTFIKTSEMRRNTEFILKSGAVGARMDFQLFDAAGAVNLNGAEVFLTLRSRIGNRPSKVRNAPCEKHANQFDNAGQCSFTFTADYARLEAGEYNLEIKAVFADGRTIYFPSELGRAYGTVLVHPTFS